MCKIWCFYPACHDFFVKPPDYSVCLVQRTNFVHTLFPIWGWGITFSVSKLLDIDFLSLYTCVSFMLYVSVSVLVYRSTCLHANHTYRVYIFWCPLTSILLLLHLQGVYLLVSTHFHLVITTSTGCISFGVHSLPSCYYYTYRVYIFWCPFTSILLLLHLQGSVLARIWILKKKGVIEIF